MENKFWIQVITGSTAVVKMGGKIDREAEMLIKELPGRVTTDDVLIDFTETGRINSMGIALLLRCFKTLRDDKGVTITLRGLSQMNRMLFKMTGILLLAEVEGHTAEHAEKQLGT